MVPLEPIGVFRKGGKGAVVEVSTTPYEAYDIEIVTDAGKTKGSVEGVHPEQIAVPGRVRFSSIRVEADGTCPAVRFSDGSEVMVSAEELYARKS